VKVKVKVAVGSARVVGLSFFLQATGRINNDIATTIKALKKRYMNHLENVSLEEQDESREETTQVGPGHLYGPVLENAL
jgi:hypothetical protein